MADREDRKAVKGKYGYVKMLRQVLKAVADFLGVSREPNDAERKLKDIYKWLG